MTDQIVLFRPMPLVRIPEPFDHPDWLFELKHDGFRALAYVEGHRLVSRRGHTFTKWDVLCTEISHAFRGRLAQCTRTALYREVCRRDLEASSANGASAGTKRTGSRRRE